MSQRASSSKTAIVAGLLAGLLAAGLGALYVYQQHAAPAARPVTAAPAEDERASLALMALPELTAWSNHIEKTSGGKSHGAVIETDPAPRVFKGKSYRQLSFYENGPEAAHRWESFLVSPNGKDILVEDMESEDPISLQRWRKEKHPMRRVGGT